MIAPSLTGVPADPAALRELLRRLEAADGPNIHLDVELWLHLGSAEVRDRQWSDRLPTDPRQECNRFDMHDAIAAGWPAAEISSAWKVPRITASIDAADALLTRLGLRWSRSLDGHVCVHSDAAGTTVRPEGATLPLRLAAGAVRAVSVGGATGG